MTPEQIITKINNTESGCESCYWDKWSNNGGGTRQCHAAQAAYPNGSKTTCPQWYKPKTRGTGAGRVRNNGERGGVR